MLPLIEFTRGALCESTHLGALAVVDETGRVVASVGDIEHTTFLRSAAKPWQALSLLASGAAQMFGLTPREVALACASHRGERTHLQVAAGMATKIGVSADDLRCGSHPVEAVETEDDLVRQGGTRNDLYNNCSGKHLGMLAQARLLRQPLPTYLEADGPVQQAILARVAHLCDMPVNAIQLGIDGCSAPNFAVPLRVAAHAMARLMAPDGLIPELREAATYVTRAMSTHPDMVQGQDGFDTVVMQALPGAVVAKRGAEGVQTLALAPGMAGPHALGLVVKIADGAARAAPLAVAEALRQLNACPPALQTALAQHGWLLPAPQRNWRGLDTGQARAVFTVTR
jgi:L-asparaginase II